jgi:hypothetical protein
MLQSEEDLTWLCRESWRDRKRLIGIMRKDRRFHAYVLGKTGVGKSTFLEGLIRQDMVRGEGLALVDPHGDLAEDVVRAVPESRRADLIYLNAPDIANPLGFNPLERIPPARRSLAAQGLLDAMKKIWSDAWGPRMEHILRNCLFTLLDQPEATLADIGRLLHDKEYRHAAVEKVGSPEVRAFWEWEYEKYPWTYRASVIAPIENKIGAFLTDPFLKRILTARRSSFDLREVMNTGKILIVNLAKGRIGEGPASLLGALLVARMGLEGLGRAEQDPASRRDFYMYLDEFQTFATESLANMLSELRKYRVNLILANQYLGQLSDDVRLAILGNVGTLLSFRLGPEDARLIAREFDGDVSASDLMSQPNYEMYLKLMVDGTASRGFSGRSFPTKQPRA